MAAPRVFVSSTYYDLKQVRADLEEFGQRMGFDVVLFEHGKIPFGGHEPIEAACFREIAKCDIVVSIIGGRIGSKSHTNPDSSISQMEVKKALELGRQMFFFVDANVNADYGTYIKSKHIATDINWNSADSIEVFQFIEFIHNLPKNNPIFPFATSQDITRILREQLLGLFQDLLEQRAHGKYESNVNALIESVETAERIISYLQQEKDANKEVMRDILFTRHPIFKVLQELLRIKTRIFFENVKELSQLLKMLSFVRVSDQELTGKHKNFMFWIRKTTEKREFVGVQRSLFTENDSLKPMSRDEWQDEFISTSLTD